MAGSRYMFLCVNDFQSSVHEVVTALYENSFYEKIFWLRIPIREAKGVVLFDDCLIELQKKDIILVLVILINYILVLLMNMDVLLIY